jgi:hypothetical protein
MGNAPFMETRASPLLDREATDVDEVVELADDLVTSAELAECTCPDWCARDHDRD